MKIVDSTFIISLLRNDPSTIQKANKLDEEGEMVAFEVWDASKRGLYKTLVDLANEKRDLVDTLLDRHVTNPA